MTALVVLAALALDRLLGEPRPHPLAAFGALAEASARRWNPSHAPAGVLVGGLVLASLVAPPVLAVGVAGFLLPAAAAWLLDVAVVALALGGGSLAEHGARVRRALMSGDIDAARHHTGCLVSRDTGDLDATGCAGASVESLLENGSDAVVATFFWYLVAGAPGVVAHRLVNTLDAMWGYRTSRWRRFGRVAARLDDVLNWLPARLTALGYALNGATRCALRAWCRDAHHWDSPNAGPVMASGAGALGLRVGGPARYHGHWRERPTLGDGRPPEAADIEAASLLLRRTVRLGVLLLLLGWWWHAG